MTRQRSGAATEPGIDWKALALWALATIPTSLGMGWAASEFWQSRVDSRIAELERRVKDAEASAQGAKARLDCLRLIAGPVRRGASYGAASDQSDARQGPLTTAGVSDWPEDMYFMVGQRDGTGAHTEDAYVVNYYRRLTLSASVDRAGGCVSE